MRPSIQTEKPTFPQRLKAFFRAKFIAAFQAVCRFLIVIMYRPQIRYTGPDTRRAVMADPCVLICNHISPMDASVIHTALRRKRVICLVARDLYERQGAHLLWSLLPMHPIERHRASVTWIHDCKRFLAEGRSVLIFPEGHRTEDGAIQRFKPGFAMLAASAKVNVVPICHNGQYNIVFGKRFRMVVGDPIHITPAPAGLRDTLLMDECEEAYRVVKQLELTLQGNAQEVTA